MIVNTAAAAAAVALLAAGTASAAALSHTTRHYYGTEVVTREDPDFGLCLPTIKYEGGLGARSAVDFTFLPADPLCAKGQQEAVNPNIITNRICDQLSTVCDANQAAQTLCREAQAKIRTLGTRDKSTADTWNTLLGFGGALTNPDGGLAEPSSSEPLRDLKAKKKRDLVAGEKRTLVECSTSEWIDTCTGWLSERDDEAAKPAPAPVVKRDVEPAPAPAPEPIVKKRSADAAPEPIVNDEKAKRQVEFKACSTDEWLDDCTGWP